MDKKKFAKVMKSLVEKLSTKVSADMGMIVLQKNGHNAVFISTHEQFSNDESSKMMRKAAKEINDMADQIDAGKLEKDGYVSSANETIEDSEPSSDGYSFSV